MMKKLWPHARPYARWIAIGVVCSAVEAVFELLIPLVMSDIVDVGIATSDTNYILRKGGLMVVMALISLSFGIGSAICSSVAGQGFGANLRRAEYDHIQEFAFSNIEKFSTASLVTRLTNDVHNMQMTLMMGMRLLVRAPVMLVAALILSIRISRQLSSVFLVALPLLVVVVGIILVRTGPMFRSLQEKTDALNLVVQENLTGIRVVKSFVKEDHEREKFAGRNSDLNLRAGLRRSGYQYAHHDDYHLRHHHCRHVVWRPYGLRRDLGSGQTQHLFHLYYPDHDVVDDGVHDLHDDDTVHRLRQADRGSAGRDARNFQRPRDDRRRHARLRPERKHRL
jgi:ABC-type multidrug transport system fused ATPase/permease subunit